MWAVVMRVEEMVGRRVREHRELLGMTQEELGRRLEPLLGKAWPRQAVWGAERGQRAFTSAELVALASVLATTPARLISSPPGLQEIEMPSGKTIPAKAVSDLSHRDPPSAEVWELADRFVGAVRQAEESSTVASTAASALVALLEEQTLGMAHAEVNE